MIERQRLPMTTTSPSQTHERYRSRPYERVVEVFVSRPTFLSSHTSISFQDSYCSGTHCALISLRQISQVSASDTHTPLHRLVLTYTKRTNEHTRRSYKGEQHQRASVRGQRTDKPETGTRHTHHHRLSHITYMHMERNLCEKLGCRDRWWRGPAALVSDDGEGGEHVVCTHLQGSSLIFGAARL